MMVSRAATADAVPNLLVAPSTALAQQSAMG